MYTITFIILGVAAAATTIGAVLETRDINKRHFVGFEKEEF